MIVRHVSRLALAAVLLAAGCSRSTEFGTAGNVNIRLTFTPAKVSADEGTTLVTVDVDNFAGDPLTLEDVKINTSAGFDKVGAITANSRNRFTAALQGLTDLKQSPVKVTVNIGRAMQTGYVEIVPGKPSGLSLVVDKETVSADEGTVHLALRILDKSQNVTPSAITLTTTAGVVSQLVSQPDGSYTAELTGLVHTADSPVEISASAGASRDEAVLQILAGTLDHFVVSQVPTPLVAGEFMPLAASARDAHDNLVTAFEDFVNVRTTRGTGDVEVSHKDGNGNYITAAGFTRQFVLGYTPSNPGEEFRIKTAAPAPGISLILTDANNHRGESNVFTVDPAPANQIVMYSQTGFNLIVSADGCVKPTVAGNECLVGATTYPNNTWKQSPLATRLEIKLRRYNLSPDEADGVATLLGGRGGDFLLTMTDAAGETHCVVTNTETCQPEIDAGLPYLGALEDKQNGKYYVNVYNLRDQGMSPYTVTARFVSLVESIDVSVVPGDLNHFAFPDMPAQRSGALGLFFLTVTARDLWENQVFSFQDTTSVFLQVGANPPQFLVQAPSALLGATFPFTTTIPTNAGAAFTANLLAQHTSGVTGTSNPFIVVPQVHATTNFVVLMPGQYDDPPPAEPSIFNFGQGVAATVTPDLGQITSTETPAEQVVGEPFQVLLLGRVTGLTVPVTDFGGQVLVGGIGSGFEVVDDSCAFSGAAPGIVEPRQLTPNFISSWTGAGGGVPLFKYESSCYVWVRATQRADNAMITADAGRSSGIPVSINGDQSSQIRVRSTEAVSLRFNNIPTPQLATVNANGGKNLFTIQVRGIDQFGNTTDNVYCASPVITSNKSVNGVDALHYTKSPAPAFDTDGILTINDAWILWPTPPTQVQLFVTCGVAGMQAQSNVFSVVSAGAAGYEFTLVPARVKAHQQFTFSARACDVMNGTGQCASENDVARTFTYAVTMTDSSGTLTPRQTRSFSAGILEAQAAMINRAGNQKICLYALGAFNCSGPITVEIGDVSYFQFDTSVFPTAVTVGDTYAVSVTAYDAGDNAMPNYTGRIYLSDLQNQVRFANNGLASADVTTVVTAGKPKLRYCTDSSCTSTQTLQVYFSDSSALDYLIVTDNRGHSGYSLPKTFKIVYGPIANVVQAPCEGNNAMPVRQQAYFALCAQAQAWNARLAQNVLKKDYTAGGDVVVPNTTLYPGVSFPFINGVAQKAFYLAPVSTNVTLQYRYKVSGRNYPLSPTYAALSLVAYPPVARAITSTSTIPIGLKVNTPFKLHIRVRDTSLTPPTDSDPNFRGVLMVTDTTGSIRPYCGAGQVAGTCGHLEGATVFTGNFTDPFDGERDQWFTIPTENYDGYIWITDGFGQSLRVGPFDVEGNLKYFTFSTIPTKIPTGVYQRVLITAWDIYDQVMTSFHAPVLLDNVPHNLNPDNSINPWPIPATSWTNGVADISFKIPVASAVDDKLTVTFLGSTTIDDVSNAFRAEVPKLTRFVWNPVPMQQPGYVDFPITITAKDQFDSLFLYSGKALYTATGGYAVRATMSTSFINGVVGGAGNPAEKIALDGVAGGNTRITATQLVGSGTPVTGASTPVTVSASTIQSFSVAFTAATLKTNCTYGLVMAAWSGPNATGNIVSNFSGQVALRWSANGVPYATNPDTASFSPATSPKFVNGQLSTMVKILGQPASNIFNLPPPDMNLNVWILGTAIQGTTTATYDVQPAGSCP